MSFPITVSWAFMKIVFRLNFTHNLGWMTKGYLWCQGSLPPVNYNRPTQSNCWPRALRLSKKYVFVQEFNRLKTLNIPVSSLLVKLWDYSNVEGRVVFSLDHLHYVATRKSTFIGAKRWVGKARYLLSRPWTALNSCCGVTRTLCSALSPHGWCQLPKWLHNSAHIESFTTPL